MTMEGEGQMEEEDSNNTEEESISVSVTLGSQDTTRDTLSDISLEDITSEEENTDSGVSIYEPDKEELEEDAEEEMEEFGYQY